jgi:hypothetical protein
VKGVCRSGLTPDKTFDETLNFSVDGAAFVLLT